LRRVNLGEMSLENPPFTAGAVGRLVKYGYTDKISRGDMKEVLRAMIETGGTPEEVCDEKGFWIKEDMGLVEGVIDKVLKNNPAAAEQYRNGEQKVFGFLMGLANKELKGAATPVIIKQALERKLKG